MPHTPYRIVCEKCKKKYFSSNPRQRKHKKCRIRPLKYPRMFYYRKHFAYARDNFICQKCKKDLRSNKGNNPPVHHINGNIKNNNLWNLVTLCFGCHTNIHKKYTKKQLKTLGKKMFSLKKFAVKDPVFVKKAKPILFKNI